MEAEENVCHLVQDPVLYDKLNKFLSTRYESEHKVCKNRQMKKLSSLQSSSSDSVVQNDEEALIKDQRAMGTRGQTLLNFKNAAENTDRNIWRIPNYACKCSKNAYA